MAEYFRKTDRGRREVRERHISLPRAARNVLLTLDSSESLDSWIGMINGARMKKMKRNAYLVMGGTGLFFSVGYLGRSFQLPFGKLDQPGAGLIMQRGDSALFS